MSRLFERLNILTPVPSEAMAHGVEELKGRYCTWMEDLPEHLTRIPVSSLAIPGSHDSFTSELDISGGIGPDNTGTVKCLGKWCCGLTKQIIKRWGTSQHLTIPQQLEIGVRYLDLRVAIKEGTIDFHFLHGLYGPPVLKVMEAVKQFVLRHPKEVILLDFNHFYNMSQTAHSQLLHMLRDVFQELLILPSHKTEPGIATLRNLWQNSGRVYVFYHNVAINSVGGFWPGYKIPSPWPNVNNVHDLIAVHEKVYINGQRRQDGSFYVWQCVVTPRSGDICRHLWGTLENTLASTTSNIMVNWLQDKNAGPSTINICLADFVESSNFIPTVLEINHTTFTKSYN